MVMVKTRLPYHLWKTAHECLYLVRRGYFLSRDKDGIQTIRCAIVENPTFASLCVVEPDLLPIEGYIAGAGIFDLVCSCDLDLDPLTFIYELDPYPVKIYRMTENELPMSRLVIVIMIQTDIRHRNYIPRRFADGQKVRPVWLISFEFLDLERLFLVCRCIFRISRSHLYIEVIRSLLRPEEQEVGLHVLFRV